MPGARRSGHPGRRKPRPWRPVRGRRRSFSKSRSLRPMGRDGARSRFLGSPSRGRLRVPGPAQGVSPRACPESSGSFRRGRADGAEAGRSSVPLGAQAARRGGVADPPAGTRRRQSGAREGRSAARPDKRSAGGAFPGGGGRNIRTGNLGGSRTRAEHESPTLRGAHDRPLLNRSAEQPRGPSFSRTAGCELRRRVPCEVALVDARFCFDRRARISEPTIGAQDPSPRVLRFRPC